MLAGMMGMHAQFTLSDETMNLAAEHKPTAWVITSTWPKGLKICTTA